MAAFPEGGVPCGAGTGALSNRALRDCRGQLAAFAGGRRQPRFGAGWRRWSSNIGWWPMIWVSRTHAGAEIVGETRAEGWRGSRGRGSTGTSSKQRSARSTVRSDSMGLTLLDGCSIWFNRNTQSRYRRRAHERRSH